MENDLLANNDLEEMAAFFNARADGYDSFMLDDIGLDSFYKRVAYCADMPINRLLDLGCGTGLELVGFFEKYPSMEVTGVDMSDEMLNKLHEKYPDKKMRLICGSYFDVDFEGMYDCVLSTLSLHHFSEGSKLSLYKRIYSSLNPGGVFIFGDHTVPTMERQQELLRINDEKRRELGIKDGEFYHFDTPFTPETEIKLMESAGFDDVKTVSREEHTSIIVAKRSLSDE